MMQAAIDAVVEYGLENATARVIGKMSGVNEVYIYRYFANKDDMLAKTFGYLDELFLETILENFPVMNYDNIDYQYRCRMMFDKCWAYIMNRRQECIFYIRYYYSLLFQELSYDEHMKRYEVLIEKTKYDCHPAADVRTVLHHILDTMLGQARKQITHPKDPEAAKENAFWLVYSVLKCGKGI